MMEARRRRRMRVSARVRGRAPGGEGVRGNWARRSVYDSLTRGLWRTKGTMKYQFSETVVAKVTGLARDALLQQRKDELEPGKDWGLVDGEVCYAPSGVRILCEKMGLTSADVQKKCRLEAHTPVPASPEPAAASTSAGPRAPQASRICCQESCAGDASPERRTHATSIVVTHDRDLAFGIADRLALMHEGRIHADGPSAELLCDRALLGACHLEPPLRMQGCPVCGK
jgi:hypothetical protein